MILSDMSIMHVLEYLQDPKCEKRPNDSLYAEYRLLSSGTLHHACRGDWSKSEGARTLLVQPLFLFAVSRPFDDYPLEPALQLTVPQVEEKEHTKTGAGMFMFHPDDEVVRDLAALLSLLCRRLITVAGKVNQRDADYSHVVFDKQPVPMPLAMSMHRVFWRLQPATVITSFDEHLRIVKEIQDYNPPPKPVYARQLTDLLLGLPKNENAESIVASCRLYALALELIHERPDISYHPHKALLVAISFELPWRSIFEVRRLDTLLLCRREKDRWPSQCRWKQKRNRCSRSQTASTTLLIGPRTSHFAQAEFGARALESERVLKADLQCPEAMDQATGRAKGALARSSHPNMDRAAL